jgi:hypothetical protein
MMSLPFFWLDLLVCICLLMYPCFLGVVCFFWCRCVARCVLLHLLYGVCWRGMCVSHGCWLHALCLGSLLLSGLRGVAVGKLDVLSRIRTSVLSPRGCFLLASLLCLFQCFEVFSVLEGVLHYPRYSWIQTIPHTSCVVWRRMACCDFTPSSRRVLQCCLAAAAP